MIWIFWGLLSALLGGMLFMAILARRNRSRLRPAGPTSIQLLRAVGLSFAGVLWTLSHPFGVYGRHRYLMDDPTDASKEYAREFDPEREEERQRSRQG
jgi:hypothetical protein